MFSRSALRSTLEVRWTSISASTSSISSRVLLPQRAYLHEATTTGGATSQFQAGPQEILSEKLSPSNKTASTPPSLSQSSQPQSTKESSSTITSSTTTSPSTAIKEPFIPESKLPVPPSSFSTPLTIRKSVAQLLPHLTTQAQDVQGQGHFITAHLHARPYLLTEGDHVRLPFLMPNVKPGDILRFNRASTIGSRDFTLKGDPYVDERMFECRVRVLGVDSEPLRIKEKTKRRQRHVQHVKSKHRYTLLRVMQVRVKGLEELVAEEGAKIVEDDADLADAAEGTERIQVN